MARPALYGERMNRVEIHLPASVVIALGEITSLTGESRNEIVRRMIEAGLKNENAPRAVRAAGAQTSRRSKRRDASTD
jgi:hypothetical protein